MNDDKINPKKKESKIPLLMILSRLLRAAMSN